MELMYPSAIIICLILLIIIFFIKFNKKDKYTIGKKVANTKYIKETDYYREKIRKYKILSNLLKALNLICIIIVTILVARPISVQTKSEDKYNRDILIGLDTSTSECEVNLELIKKFKEIIPDIDGDRIGIIIFNTAPIVYCPLTNDYDYINECLNKIQEQLEIVIENGGNIPYSTNADNNDTYTFWYGGVIANNETRGSSLVGDGLAGTIYSFPDLKSNNQRTRIILFATDNAVSGTETVSIEQACDLCKQYNINLYAYCPTTEMNVYASKDKIANYKKAVEQNANGKFYNGNLSEMMSSIVTEIKETKKTLLKTSKKTYITDHPEFFLIFTIIIFLIIIIIEKRIRI